MKEKRLPRRGFKERKKEIERFFLLLLPRLVSLSLRFLFLALHPFLFPPSRNSERRTSYLELTGKKKNTNPDSDGMSLPTTTTRRSLIELVLVFCFCFLDLHKEKKIEFFISFLWCILSVGICTYPFPHQ